MEEGFNTVPQQKKELKIGDVGQYHLSGIAKWVKIMAIIGTIIMAFIVIVAIYLIQSGLRGMAGVGVVYLIVAAIYIYPIVKAFSISSRFRAAVQSMSDADLESGLSDMRSLCTFLGVLSIIGLVIFVLSIILSITAAKTAESYLYYY
jgi:hypothetical protein